MTKIERKREEAAHEIRGTLTEDEIVLEKKPFCRFVFPTFSPSWRIKA